MTYPHNHFHVQLTSEEHLAHHRAHDERMRAAALLSRRDLLKGSVAVALSAVVLKFDSLFGTSLADLISDPKRIFLAPDDHTDYFWSEDDVYYRQAFLTMLDYYLDRADATAGSPAEYQSRWNCDGSFWLWTYEKNRTTAQFARLIERIRDGHISVPLNALCVCLGGAPAEAVLRGMYYPGRIERRHGLRFDLAYEGSTSP